MVTRQPQNKEQILIGVANDLIHSLHAQKGLISFDNTALKNSKRIADKNKEGDFALYYCVLSLIETTKANFTEAKRLYDNAMKIDQGRMDILPNYVSLLYRLSELEQTVERATEYLKTNKSCDTTFIKLVYSSFFLLQSAPLITQSKEFIPCSPNGKDLLETSKELIMIIDQIKIDIESIDISVKEYSEFMALLNKFYSMKSHAEFDFRISIKNGLDQYLKMEVFIDVNVEDIVKLNSEFDSFFIDYAIEQDSLDMLGKFLVAFKLKNSRYDGTENPESLYIGVNEEMVA